MQQTLRRLYRRQPGRGFAGPGMWGGVNPVTVVADPKGEDPRGAGQTVAGPMVAARATGKAARILSKDRRAKGREGAGSLGRPLGPPDADAGPPDAPREFGLRRRPPPGEEPPPRD